MKFPSIIMPFECVSLAWLMSLIEHFERLLWLV